MKTIDVAVGNSLYPSINKQLFGFTGYEFDDVTDQLFSPARAYSSKIGRFTSTDTHWHPENMIYGDNPQQITASTLIPDLLAIAQSNNMYAYTMNNPLRYIDPLGLNCEDDSLGISKNNNSGMPKWLQKVLEKSGWDLLKALFNNADNLSLQIGYHLGLAFNPSTDGFFNRLMDNSPTIGRIGKAFKKGLPFVGTIDFSRRLNDGASTAEAAFMATGTTISGFYGGKAGAVIGTALFPGVGTVIGGVAGALLRSWLFEDLIDNTTRNLPSDHGFLQSHYNNPTPEEELWRQFRNPSLIRRN